MSAPPVVTGAGVVSPLGAGAEPFGAALLAGAPGFAEVTLFDTATLRCHRGGEISAFNPGEHLGEGNFRPLDRTGLLATAAVRRALDDAGWTAESAAETELGLVLGTMFGSLKTIAEFDRRALVEGPIYAKPMDFANSVINAAAGQAAIWHHLPGANATLAGGPAAGLAALALAADLIRGGQAEALLAGGADELCFESFLGFERRGDLLANGEEPRPFTANRRGFLLGEGAALLMLELPAAAHAMAAALAAAEVSPSAVDVLSAAASGSPALDRTEAVALGQVFGTRAARLPILAVKAQTGEALGASGAFQTLALLAVFSSGTVPGIRGLGAVEAGLPIDPENGWTRPLDARIGLVHAAAGDGLHVALILRRMDE